MEPYHYGCAPASTPEPEYQPDGHSHCLTPERLRAAEDKAGDADAAGAERAQRKRVNAPADHPLWAEAYWAYSLFSLLQPPEKGQTGPPPLGAEGCCRMLKGHGQGCITKEQMETVLGSLAVGEVQIDRPVLEEGHESWLAKKRAARRFKKEEKRSKAREKKELTFVDFLAILTVWTRARDSRSLADLRYHKHRVLFDMRADWMLNRMLWVAIFLSAFFAFPYSFVTKLLGDVARDWAEGGMDQDLAKALLMLLFIVPYFLFFGILGWLHIPGMNRWLMLAPVIGGCCALAVTVHTIVVNRDPWDFPDYGYAIGSLNIVNIISVLVLFVALVLCLLGLFGITCPKCPTQLFWRRRADVNRAFVSYAVDELGRGVHYAEAIPPQSMKVSIKEWLNLVRGKTDPTRSPIIVGSSMMMALAIMLGIILIACVGFFQLASVQQAELYEYAANMSSVLEPDNQTIQEVAAKYNLTTDVVEDIYDDLTSRSGAAALSKVAGWIRSLADVLLWSAYPMFILSLLIIALQAPFILIGYITTVRKWRGLKQRVLWEHYNIVTASAFVANAWAVALTGFVILAVLLTLVILCFSWDFLFDLWWAYRSYIFTWCIAYLIQSVLMRMVFMKRVLSHNGKVEKYVVGFSAMAYLDSVIALITSLTAGVFRLLYVFGFSAVWFVRLDYSMFPKGRLMMMDSVWKSWYVSVVRFELASNPFLDTFRDILCQQTLALFGPDAKHLGAVPVPGRDPTQSVSVVPKAEVLDAKEELLCMYSWLGEFAAKDDLPLQLSKGLFVPLRRDSGTPTNSRSSSSFLSDQQTCYDFITPIP